MIYETHEHGGIQAHIIHAGRLFIQILHSDISSQSAEVSSGL